MLSIALAGILTLRLPGLINSIATGGGGEALGIFIDSFCKLRRPVSVWSFVFFFSVFLSLAAARTLVEKASNGSSGDAVAEFEKMLLKIPTSTAWLLFNANLFMPRD